MINTAKKSQRTKRTLESWMLSNGKQGDVFYTDKADRYLTSLSCYYKRKISTERLILVKHIGKELKATQITKVTLL